MSLQRVLPDGGCAFRAVATSFVYQVIGINIGSGTPDGYENTFKDIIANVCAKWLRRLAVLALCSTRGNSIDVCTELSTSPDTMMSFLQVLTRANHTFQQNGIQYCGTSAQRLNLSRVLQPPSKFVGRCAPRRKMPTGLTAEALVETSNQTFRQYCTRMGRDFTWGGEPELYVLSTFVLQLPIVVLNHAGEELQSYNKEWGTAHVVKLQFSGNNHYDAIIDLPDSVPPLFLL